MIALVGGSHGEDLAGHTWRTDGAGSWFGIAGRGADDHPLLDGRIAQGRERVVAVARPRRAQGEVEHLCSFVHGPLDASHHVAHHAAALVGEHLGHIDQRFRCDADVLAAAGRPAAGSDAGHVCPVPVAVGDAALAGKVAGGNDASRKVRMIGVDAGVSDGDLDPGPSPTIGPHLGHL